MYYYVQDRLAVNYLHIYAFIHFYILFNRTQKRGQKNSIEIGNPDVY